MIRFFIETNATETEIDTRADAFAKSFPISRPGHTWGAVDYPPIEHAARFWEIIRSSGGRDGPTGPVGPAAPPSAGPAPRRADRRAAERAGRRRR